MLIAFDFDGVLADSRAVVGALWRQLAQERGRPPPDPSAWRAATLRQNLRALGVRPWSLPGLVRRARRAVAEHWAELEPLAEGLGAVRWAAARGWPLAIVSSNTEAAIAPFLARHLADVRFVGVVGDAPLFAKHRPLRRLLAGAGCPPRQGVYVGDEARDLICARRAGARGVGVAWGKEGPDLLRAAGALHVAENADQLCRILARLEG